MCTISKVVGKNMEKEIHLPNKEYISGHRWERINVVVQCIDTLNVVYLNILLSFSTLFFLLFFLS